jgi:hypothetical protein
MHYRTPPAENERETCMRPFLTWSLLTLLVEAWNIFQEPGYYTKGKELNLTPCIRRRMHHGQLTTTGCRIGPLTADV